MSRQTTLAGLLESFFSNRLVAQRNATAATVASYRDALRLLVLFAAERAHRRPHSLVIGDLDRDVVLDFLEQLERKRGNGPKTRNARLTAIRSFFRHVGANDPGSLGIAQRVLAIPTKRTTTGMPPHLAADQLAALLEAPDKHTPQGRRDRALLLFLARTGARVSEAVGVDAADLRLERPCQVLPHVRRVVARAGLTDVRISPHVLRHSLAMQLLRARVDLVTIQPWLGHAQVATTHRYAEADVEMMRRTLARSGVATPRDARYKPTDAVLRPLTTRRNM